MGKCVGRFLVLIYEVTDNQKVSLGKSAQLRNVWLTKSPNTWPALPANGGSDAGSRTKKKAVHSRFTEAVFPFSGS
jgi:hypothetical protein